MELKAMTVLNIQQMGCYDNALVYFKSESDKVIAEKDAEIAELKEQVYDYGQGLYVMQARAEKEARHQKYKRCLDKAEICRQEWCTLYYERKRYRENPFLDHLMSRKNRHKEKWLELAEKFKEAK